MRCYEASMMSVLKYFFPEEKYSLEQLDQLVERKPNMWTYTHQIVPVLYQLGLNVKFYSSDSLDPLLNKESFMQVIRDTYKNEENIKFVLQRTDIDTIVKTAIKCKELNLFEQRKLDFSEIEKHIDEGHIPLILIDRYILEGLTGSYHGHFVVLTGYDDNFVYYHENLQNSPLSNRKVEKEKFIKAWDNASTNRDIVIVFGKINDIQK